MKYLQISVVKCALKSCKILMKEINEDLNKFRPEDSILSNISYFQINIQV